MRRMFIFSTIFSVLLSVFSPLVTNATSAYDNWYQTTDTLEIQDTANTCDLQTVNDGWLDTMLDVEKWVQWHYPVSKTDTENRQASFVNAIHNGRWAVSQVYESATKKYIYVTWTETPNLQVNFYSGVGGVSLSSSGTLNRVTIGCPKAVGHNSTEPMVYNFSPSTAGRVSNPDGSVKNYFAYADVINYPESYSGLPIRTNFSQASPYTPAFAYVVDDLNITGIICTNDNQCRLPIESSNLGAQLRIKNSDGEIIYTKNYNFRDKADSSLEYNFPSYGDYILEIDWQALIPAIFPSDVEVHTLKLPITVDGSTYASGTGTQNCDDEGNCEAVSLYEDCDATDILCHIRNGIVAVKSLLISLFVPSSSYLTNKLSSLKQTVQDKFGILFFPFSFLIDLFTALSSASSSCAFSSTSIPGVTMGNTLFGKPVNLNVCSAETYFPGIYNIVTFFIRLVTVSALILALYYRISNLLGFDGLNKKGHG